MALLENYRDRWAARLASTEVADRDSTEIGLRLAYRAAGLSPPGEIVWKSNRNGLGLGENAAEHCRAES